MIDIREASTLIDTPFILHKMGVELKREPTFDEWLLSCQQLAALEKGMHFVIGDMLNIGESQWGEKYTEAIEQTGFDYQTLANDKWVASSIKFSLRRENLSFGHHKEVAPYTPDEQDFLLERAETLGLSVRHLREQKESLLHPPKTIAPGQLWQLGRHLLYCGDSSSQRFVDSTKGDRATFAFADPPYNAGVAQWDIDFTWGHDYLIDSAPIVAVTPGISAIKSFMRTTKMPYKWSMSYWIDNGMTRGALGFGNWIYVALFTEGSLYRNTQDLVRVVEDEDMMQRISITGGDHDDFKHKGRKPLAMMTHIVELFTKPDEVVIDPFLGTGTTLIACEDTGRICIGAEENLEFCGSIIKRWERRTGKEAHQC